MTTKYLPLLYNCILFISDINILYSIKIIQLHKVVHANYILQGLLIFNVVLVKSALQFYNFLFAFWKP